MITWSEFLMVVLVVLVCYYTVLILVFYKAEARRLLRGASPKSPRGLPSPQADQLLFREEEVQQPLNAASAAPMHSLVDELQAYVFQAGEQGITIDEVKSSLTRLLHKYPGIKGSKFQEGITNLIEVIVETHCGVRLRADELGALWTAGQP